MHTWFKVCIILTNVYINPTNTLYNNTIKPFKTTLKFKIVMFSFKNNGSPPDYDGARPSEALAPFTPLDTGWNAAGKPLYTHKSW